MTYSRRWKSGLGRRKMWLIEPCEICLKLQAICWWIHFLLLLLRHSQASEPFRSSACAWFLKYVDMATGQEYLAKGAPPTVNWATKKEPTKPMSSLFFSRLFYTHLLITAQTTKQPLLIGGVKWKPFSSFSFSLPRCWRPTWCCCSLWWSRCSR